MTESKGAKERDPVDRASRFCYRRLDIDAEAGELCCHYSSDDDDFVERVAFDGTAGSSRWATPEARAAARWIYLLAGVSYYKTGAAELVDCGEALSDAERAFLRTFYVNGLGEFAYRNGLEIGDFILVWPAAPAVPKPQPPWAPKRAPVRPLIPFGGGIDSIVTTEVVKRQSHGDPALFIVSRAGDRFAAIETAAAATGLPIVRADRAVDPKVLRSAERGYFNGHVPVTGIISAVAVLAAVLGDRDGVVMSNEASASAGNLVHGGRTVNHQWSKGMEFEAGFRAMFNENPVGVEYFSLLRASSELWVARQFAALPSYHRAFRSCNKAFYIDKARRLDHWCGKCDKCCFVDLILAPFMEKADLGAVFGGHEPLANEGLAEQFRVLLAVSSASKPFDCVGDTSECRSALWLAAQRPDRRDSKLIRRLLGELPPGSEPPSGAFEPSGPHFIPDAYAPVDLVV